MKILIVDDELKIRTVIKEYALASGYDVFEATDGLSAYEMVKTSEFDCIILDLMMPNLDGFTTLKKIRQIKKTPIIVLSARTNEDDKLFTFEHGADDYVTKPFSPKELMARIKVVCERNQLNNKTTYNYSGLLVDELGRSVSINNQKINMTPKEFDLLIYLVKNKNIAISRQRLLSALWNYDFCGDDRTIDTHIKMLRKSLGPYKDKIVTVRGMGYKFEA